MKMSVLSIIGMGLTAVGGIISAIGTKAETSKAIADEVAKAVKEAMNK